MGHLKRPGGFTLPEAMVSLALVVIGLSMAVGHFGQLIDKYRFAGRIGELVTDIQYARSEAVSRSTATHISFANSPGLACYIVHTGPAGACECGANGTARCAPTAQDLKVVSMPEVHNLHIRGGLMFDPMLGTAKQFGTVTVLSASGHEADVIVNITGRTRVCSRGHTLPGYRSCA